jgi:hypothetical protein
MAVAEAVVEDVTVLIEKKGEEPEEKSATRSDFPLFSSIDHKKHWSITAPRRDNYGNVNLYWRVAPGQAVRFWSPQDQPSEVVFTVEQRSFAPKAEISRTGTLVPSTSGPDPNAADATSNVMNLCFRLNDEQQEWTTSFEEHVRRQAVEHSFLWFGRAMTSIEVDRDFRSPTVPGTPSLPAYLKVNVILSGRDATVIKIHGPDGEKREEGQGAAFVEKVQGPTKWKGDHVRVVLCPWKLQYRNRILFFSLRATHVQIHESPDRDQVDPFAI